MNAIDQIAAGMRQQEPWPHGWPWCPSRVEAGGPNLILSSGSGTPMYALSLRWDDVDRVEVTT